MRKKRTLVELARKAEGLHTAETLAKALGVSKKTAINIASKLKKAGYLEYFSGGRRKRIYKISILKTKFKGNPGLYETINKYSRLKVQEPYQHFIHGKKLSIEEALVLAVTSRNQRLILASLNLFAHIENWSLLNELAKKYNVQRNIGALYVAAKLMIRARKMDERTKNSLLKGNGRKYLIENVSSKDFREIEEKWKVKIPLNLKDLERLKTG